MDSMVFSHNKLSRILGIYTKYNFLIDNHLIGVYLMY